MNIDIFKAKHGVKFITISNDAGLEVVLSTFGASIYNVKLDMEPMIITPRYFDIFYHSPKYYGKTVGRIAGRLKSGVYKVGDKEYHVEQNEGSNCLHGGKAGISEKNWLLQIKRFKEGIAVTFHLTTKKGEGGFNGKVEYRVTYSIAKDENNINVKYYAKCSEDTCFNLTNHTYWNLANQKDILLHRLQIKSSNVSTFDPDDFTITGTRDVTNTVFDFRNAKLIKSDLKDSELHTLKWLNGYDHRFLFDPVDDNESQVSLDCGNYKLNIYTDFNAVHVYTSGFTSHDELINEDYDDIYRGIALECSNFYPEEVKARTPYSHFVKYKFRRKSDEK